MRRWTWVVATVVAIGLALLVVALVALLTAERQESRPVSPSTTETPVGTVPVG